MFTKYKILNLISFTATIIFNALTIKGFGPFKPISNISNSYQNCLTPPNWTFGIWGVIYSGLLLFNIAQFIPKFKLDQTISNINLLFPFSCILNIAWLLIFGLQGKIFILISLLIILFLIIILCLLQSHAFIFKNKETHVSKIICVDIPFSLYLGWIIFATVANFGTVITAWLPSNKINEFTFFTASFITTGMVYLINLVFNNNYVTEFVFFYVATAFAIKYYQDNTLLFNVVISTFAVSFLCLFVKIIIDCRRYVKNHQKKFFFTPFIPSRNYNNSNYEKYIETENV